MGYTRKEIIDKCEIALKDVKNFYKNDFVNYRGKTTDTEEYYTEVICEWLIKNIFVLNEIPMITREKTYYTHTHDGIPKNKNSNRKEELIAMEMFRQKEISYVGEILDYQTPLKNKRSDEAGKIDLLSYDGRILRILELKEPESDETMLRCVLEGYTYLKTLNIKKHLNDFNLPSDTIVKTNPLVAFGGSQYNEMNEEKNYLKKLINILNCIPLYFKKEDNQYIIVEE